MMTLPQKITIQFVPIDDGCIADIVLHAEHPFENGENMEDYLIWVLEEMGYDVSKAEED